MEQDLRKQAIERYLKGESPKRGNLGTLLTNKTEICIYPENHV